MDNQGGLMVRHRDTTLLFQEASLVSEDKTLLINVAVKRVYQK